MKQFTVMPLRFAMRSKLFFSKVFIVHKTSIWILLADFSGVIWVKPSAQIYDSVVQLLITIMVWSWPDYWTEDQKIIIDFLGLHLKTILARQWRCYQKQNLKKSLHRLFETFSQILQMLDVTLEESQYLFGKIILIYIENVCTLRLWSGCEVGSSSNLTMVDSL